MQRAEVEARVVERTPLSGHVGKSGAALERWRLDDGTRLVVKRLQPTEDLLMTLTGDTVGREYALWSSGLLDRLPDGVRHAVVGGWREGDGAVVLMRDLDDAVLTWDDRLDAAECTRVLDGIAALHRAFRDVPLGPPEAFTPLPAFLTLFAPDRMRPHLDGANPLPRATVRGWEIFSRTVPADVADPVLGLLDSPGPLVRALLDRPRTLVHGDLATVNMAPGPDGLTLLDWGMPVIAPGALDVARFVAGCSSVVELTREQVLDVYAEAAGSAADPVAMRLALLAGTVWLGWNKALDAAEHPDPETRDREREDLAWWVAESRATLRAGLL
jgi:hypothetical protein